ncbi:hypothetical protein EEL31_08665 [Brevibacillus laterosporus]|nr:hypothetical protein [Brevibacillus laterosporus]TPG68581.1 hypothetical protein EEL31_08665 [Brevibacillus laterosporus]
MVIGQLVESCEGKCSRLGVIIDLFDGEKALIKTTREYYMYFHNPDLLSEEEKKYRLESEGYIKLLYKDGKPAMAKKSWLGKWKLNVQDYE